MKNAGLRVAPLGLGELLDAVVGISLGRGGLDVSLGGGSDTFLF